MVTTKLTQTFVEWKQDFTNIMNERIYFLYDYGDYAPEDFFLIYNFMSTKFCQRHMIKSDLIIHLTICLSYIEFNSIL